MRLLSEAKAHAHPEGSLTLPSYELSSLMPTSASPVHLNSPSSSKIKTHKRITDTAGRSSDFSTQEAQQEDQKEF